MEATEPSELLTIGAFARATRLTPKALRLYDERGVLTPAHVDPSSGYRRYRRDQVEDARLIAWLRRLGMPLARIPEICSLEPGPAADAIAGYWRQVEDDVAERRDIAAFLVDHLFRRDKAMTESTRELSVVHAVCCDRGLVRESNQDVCYAGEHLLAVADGFGGTPETTPMSRVAVDALGPLDAPASEDTLLGMLEETIHRAEEAVRSHIASAGISDVGTTLTALLCFGERIGIVHVGDCRVYLLRRGELTQITHDHTVVQSLVDEGRLAPEDMVTHPQRSTLFKALTGARESAAEPELQLRDAEAGDRYLICSDGLHTVLSTADLREVLAGTAGPQDAARSLVECANEAGGPDNIACVVADFAATH